jgi:hypothetical protein
MVAMAGLLILLVAGVLPMMLLTSTAVRVLGLAVGLPLAALMLCPNRLTGTGRLFALRLGLSVLVGLCFILSGLMAIPAASDGQHDPRVLICLPINLLIGICLPGCLWWRSRLEARKKTREYQEL